SDAPTIQNTRRKSGVSADSTVPATPVPARRLAGSRALATTPSSPSAAPETATTNPAVSTGRPAPPAMAANCRRGRATTPPTSVSSIAADGTGPAGVTAVDASEGAALRLLTVEVNN